MRFNRRELFAAGAALAARAAEPAIHVAGRAVEIQIAPVSPHTVRLTVYPLEDGRVSAVPADGSLVRAAWGAPLAKIRVIRPDITGPILR